MTSLRTKLIVVAVNAAVVIGFFGAAELIARRVQARRLGPGASSPADYMDRWTAWANAPGYTRIDIHHDGQGFRRDAEVSLSKPPNTVRIFFLGGSAAYGCEGLFPDLDPDWHRIYNRDLIDVWLEHKLQQEHPERHWEVINAAVNEYRMHQHLSLIYEKLLRYRPDMMIFFDGHNDISGLSGNTAAVYDAYAETPHEAEFRNLVYPKSLRSLFFINETWLRDNSVLFAGLERRLEAINQFGTPADAGQAVHSPEALQDLTPELQARARNNLAQAGYYRQEAERIQSALSHEGILSLFSLQPEAILSSKPLTPVEAKFVAHMREISGRYGTYMWEQLQPRIVRDMSESARTNAYTFVDTADAFRGVTQKTFTDYCHLTPYGNQLIADRLYDAMSDLIPKLIERSSSVSSAQLSR